MAPMVSVKVVRPFYWNGAPLEKDKVIDLPKVFAAEVVASNKAVYYERAPHAAGNRGDKPNGRD